MATKHSQGPPTRHILASQGPSRSPFDAYSTSYSVQNRRRSCPTVSFRHKGTGYIANFRPAVYYNKEADTAENPIVANLLSDVYGSQTSRDFTRPCGPTGKEQIPLSVLFAPSGFTHNLPFTRALSCHKAPSSTQYSCSYPTKHFRSDDIQASSSSNKEETGFIHACNVEPITYRPDDNHAGEPGKLTHRPTGHSLMKQDFRKNPTLVGNEPLPFVRSHRDDANGYIKGNQCTSSAQPAPVPQRPVPPQVVPRLRKCDPVAYTMITHPRQYTSFTRITFTGSQHHYNSTPQTAVGKQELSGFAENYPPFVGTPAAKTQPLTHYTDTFRDKRPQTGYPAVLPTSMVPNGFTKSTKVHGFGPARNNTEILRAQQPYAAKALLTRDPYFVDCTHDHKVRQVA